MVEDGINKMKELINEIINSNTVKRVQYSGLFRTSDSSGQQQTKLHSVLTVLPQAKLSF